jgi:hypothetical protein
MFNSDPMFVKDQKIIPIIYYANIRSGCDIHYSFHILGSRSDMLRLDPRFRSDYGSDLVLFFIRLTLLSFGF